MDDATCFDEEANSKLLEIAEGIRSSNIIGDKRYLLVLTHQKVASGIFLLLFYF
jgi:hypothetical protein